MVAPNESLGCSAPDCPAEIQNHKWAKIKAREDGWFFQVNGDQWCPDHLPQWVAQWRLDLARRRGTPGIR